MESLGGTWTSEKPDPYAKNFVWKRRYGRGLNALVEKGYWEIWVDDRVRVASGTMSGPPTAKAAADAWMTSVSEAALDAILERHPSSELPFGRRL
jgi:hypothetical protein